MKNLIGCTSMSIIVSGKEQVRWLSPALKNVPPRFYWMHGDVDHVIGIKTYWNTTENLQEIQMAFGMFSGRTKKIPKHDWKPTDWPRTVSLCSDSKVNKTINGCLKVKPPVEWYNSNAIKGIFTFIRCICGHANEPSEYIMYWKYTLPVQWVKRIAPQFRIAKLWVSV